MTLNKTIKTDDDTISQLNILKQEFQERFQDDFTNNQIINELIFEHQQNMDPKIQQNRERELLQGYVNKETFDSVYNRKVELENKIDQLSEENNKIVKESEQLKEIFNSEKQKYQDNIDDLKKELTVKKQELSLSNQKINELTEKIMDLEPCLKESQDKFERCNSDYINLKRLVEREYVKKKSLEVMYHISWFLADPFHRHSAYTIHGLHNEIRRFIIEEIREALEIVGFFPVNFYQQDGVTYFYFNKKYPRK